jgi:hypothetical protein
MVVICCGMYRAASTLQYNVASHLVENFHSGVRLGYMYDGRSLEQRLQNAPIASNWVVIKAHEPDDCFTELLKSGAAIAIYSYRDIRDVAYSIVHKRNSTFEREIEGTDLLPNTIRDFRYWTGFPGCLVQRYESLTADPIRAVNEIATALGISLPATSAEEIARQYSLENNQASVRRIADTFRSRGVDLTDPANSLCHDEATLFHWNHIRDGRSGGWKQVATPRQLAVLARHCGQWLIEHGYETDWNWVQPALEYLLFEKHDADQDRIRELVRLLDAHRESLATLHQQLAAERVELVTLRGEVHSSRLEYARQQERIHELVLHLDAHRESLATLHQQLASERAELVVLREQLRISRLEPDAQQERIQDLLQHLEAHRESLATLHQQLASERGELIALREQARISQAEPETLKERIEELVQHLEAHRESLATLHQQLATERQELVTLREQSQNEQHENTALRQQIQELTNQLNEHRESLTTLHQHLAVERDELIMLRDQVHIYRSEHLAKIPHPYRKGRAG